MIKPLGIKEFNKIKDELNCLIIDTRLPDYFENGFITGSINIPLKDAFEELLSLIAETDKQLLFIFKPSTEATAIERIEKAGITNIAGYLLGGFDTWLNHIDKYDMVISISSEELVLDALHNEKAIIIDVRSEDEYKQSHIKQAINIPLQMLLQKPNKLNPNDETLIYCENGDNSMLAASYLKHKGLKNVKNVWGGFKRISVEPKFEAVKS
ncbi:MAG: rhodanese-like domain-containing protein [Bacteroidia bacterium]